MAPIPPLGPPQTESRWGLRRPAPHDAAAKRIERRWRWLLVLVLLATVPAFYAELLDVVPPHWAGLIYACAGLGVGLSLVHVASRTSHPWRHVAHNPTEMILASGLLLAAALPASSVSATALGVRLAVALLVLLRMVWALQHWLTRGGLAYLLFLSLAVLGLCGVGFWWLEPRTPTLGDGLWLAFTTAATVGYGDLVPSTPASKIFSVFVVLLGYGVLSIVTAAIAATWIETEERRIEREIMQDLHRQLGLLRQELVALRSEVRSQHTLTAGLPTAKVKEPVGGPAAPGVRRRSETPPSRGG